MSMSSEIQIYKRKDIEDFIKKYPNTKICFEKCGGFIDNHYIIMSNDYVMYTDPSIQLQDWIIEVNDTLDAYDDFRCLNYQTIAGEVDRFDGKKDYWEDDEY